MKEYCKPVVKWAGGKRQLLDEIEGLMPKKFDIYFEPFFGGGALFFDICPEKAVINDSNTYLINMYQWIKKAPIIFMSFMENLQNTYNQLLTDEDKKNFYYKIRQQFNECVKNKETSIECASYFLFLNKACFNGIYRENSKGLFNVPTGRKKILNTYDFSNINLVSMALSDKIILNTDYTDACKDAKMGDFVFFDPPYYDTFSDYQKNGFSEEEHKRLAALFKELSLKGVYVMLTNSNTDFVKNLYQDYNIKVVSVKRMINRNANNRIGEEVIITNYK